MNVIAIANDPQCDGGRFPQIRHALQHETQARAGRRMMKLLKASQTPNLVPA